MLSGAVAWTTRWPRTSCRPCRPGSGRRPCTRSLCPTSPCGRPVGRVARAADGRAVVAVRVAALPRVRVVDRGRCRSSRRASRSGPGRQPGFPRSSAGTVLVGLLWLRDRDGSDERGARADAVRRRDERPGACTPRRSTGPRTSGRSCPPGLAARRRASRSAATGSAKRIGESPLHVPGSAFTLWLSFGVPKIDGAFVFDGGTRRRRPRRSGTETAEFEPEALVAVTRHPDRRADVARGRGVCVPVAPAIWRAGAAARVAAEPRVARTYCRIRSRTRSSPRERRPAWRSPRSTGARVLTGDPAGAAATTDGGSPSRPRSSRRRSTPSRSP